MGLPATTMIVYRFGDAAPLENHYGDTLPIVKSIAPANHTVFSFSSTPCKLVSWWKSDDSDKEHALLLHLADWLLWLLREKMGISDHNNALKVDYDSEVDSCPSWLLSQPYSIVLPSVRAPGTSIGYLQEHIRSQFGMFVLLSSCPNYEVYAVSQRDSVAALLAACATQPEKAVKSVPC